MKIIACQLPDVQCDVDRALSLIETHAAIARRHGADLILFPECYLQGYDVSAEHVAGVALDLHSREFDDVLRRLQNVEPVIVIGLIEKEGAKFYNTAAVIDRGRLVARYRKAHLLDGERDVFESGNEPVVFDVCGVTIGINICYDLQFADAAGAAASAGAEILVCPCNNMMRLETAERYRQLHNATRCERAREAHLWIVSSDVTGEQEGRISYGPTAIIDSDGEVIAQVPLMTTGMVEVEFPSAEATIDRFINRVTATAFNWPFR